MIRSCTVKKMAEPYVAVTQCLPGQIPKPEHYTLVNLSQQALTCRTPYTIKQPTTPKTHHAKCSLSLFEGNILRLADKLFYTRIGQDLPAASGRDLHDFRRLDCLQGTELPVYEPWRTCTCTLYKGQWSIETNALASVKHIGLHRYVMHNDAVILSSTS